MIDKHILRARLVDKFENIGLHEIVNECFMQALPFGEENTKPYAREFYNYSKSIMNSLGGYKVMKNAMESTTDPMAVSLLKKIDGICSSMAMEAADRTMKDADPNDTLPDIVDNAAFTKAEINKFIQKADNIDTDDIAKIIKDKTVAVIKDEQDAYDKDEALQTSLQDEANKITGDDKNDLMNQADEGSEKEKPDDDDSDDKDDSKEDKKSSKKKSDDDEDVEDPEDNDDSDKKTKKPSSKESDDDDLDPDGDGKDEDDEPADDGSDSKSKKSKKKDSKDDFDDLDDDDSDDDDSDKKKKDKKKDSKEKAVESYLDLILDNKRDPRKYTSLFQKMQDICLEATLRTNEEYTEIPFGALADVTIKGAMEAFGYTEHDFTHRKDESILSAMESLSRLSGSPEKSREELMNCGNTATLGAVIMYTAMETLNTLYLVQPSQKDILAMCSQKSMVGEIKKQETGKILAGMESCLMDVKRSIGLAHSVEEVKAGKERLVQYKAAIESLSNADTDVVAAQQKLVAATNDVETLADNKEAILTKTEPVQSLPYYMQREKEANVDEFNRINSVYVNNNPDIKEVVVKMPQSTGNLKIDDDQTTGTVAMELICKKEDRTPVTESFIQITRRKEYGQTLEQVVQEAVKSSRLSGVKVTLQK